MYLTTWHDEGTAGQAWPDSRGVADLEELLDVAKDACWAFVPESTRKAILDAQPTPNGSLEEAPTGVPARFRLAQLRQAQNVARTTPGTDGQLGLDGYAPRVYVFGYDVRTILIPPTAGPQVF